MDNKDLQNEKEKALTRDSFLYFEMRLKEMDTRYQLRFEAGDRAMSTALTAAKEAVNAALQAAKEAVIKAENATEKRFEGVNEFRMTLSDQATNFVPRSEYEQTRGQVADLRQMITDAASAYVQRVEYGQMRDGMGEKIAMLAQRADKLEGRSAGIAASWGILVGVAVVAGTAASLLTHFFK